LSKNIIELKKAGTQEDEIADQVKAAAAVFFSGGSDTTMGTLTIFFREMVRRPQILKKVHQEIDEVVERDRFPTFEDRPNLPYLECVLQETLR
jgi:cytochrome P450